VQTRYAVDPRLSTLLGQLGVPADALLRRTGLPRDLFARAQVVLEPRDYFALWNALEDFLDEPTLPILVARAMSPDLFSPPLFAALCSPDFNQAARRIQTYKPLIGPLRVGVDVGDDDTSIACDWGIEPPPASLAMAELLFWVTLVRHGTRTDVRPLAVEVPVLPADPAPYADFLGCPLSRGTRHTIRFRAADAARRFVTGSEEMWTFFEPELRRRLALLEAGASTEDRVRAVLLELLPAGRTSMSEVGRELAMSSRTLQRRLAGEGTSFQAVLAGTREALARHYLAHDGLTTAEVSFLLGYAEPSSFYRAFHEWTGQTPDRVRAGVAREPVVGAISD
jgi:AraC-like DNA-binding protein